MKEKILKNTILSCVLIFIILLIVHTIETVFIRMDESILGENFINKVFGLIVIWVVLRLLDRKWSDIGFKTTNFVQSIGIGLLIGACVFSVAYLMEILILKGQGLSVRLGIFTTGFSLIGESSIHTGIGYILMCIFFNIINVIMEEGTFRGLFATLIKIDHNIKIAIIFQALLFGIWHIVTPFHNLVDGAIGVGVFIGLSIGYVILAGLMGIKWGLLYQITGNLYAGMADHFFNNCIATNLLHVITDSGIDEMMIIRVMLAQILSFVIVYITYYKTRKSNKV